MATKTKFTPEEKAAFNAEKKAKVQANKNTEAKKAYKRPYTKKKFVHKVDFSQVTQTTVPAKSTLQKIWDWLCS